MTHSKYKTEEEIKDLVEAFEARTLPIEKWTHEAHLTVAIWYLRSYRYYAALCLIRSGIIAYNIAAGGKNTPQSGYHETITLLWAWLIGTFLERYPGNESILHITNDFLKQPYVNREVLFQFYSRDLLFSIKARATWVEPDKHPLDFNLLEKL